MKKNDKQNKKEKKKQKKNGRTPDAPAAASNEPTELLGPKAAAGALVAALQEAARLGVKLAVDRDGYTVLHGRVEERCGKTDLSGVVVRRTPARRERAAATGIV